MHALRSASAPVRTDKMPYSLAWYVRRNAGGFTPLARNLTTGREQEVGRPHTSEAEARAYIRNRFDGGNRWPGYVCHYHESYLADFHDA